MVVQLVGRAPRDASAILRKGRTVAKVVCNIKAQLPGRFGDEAYRQIWGPADIVDPEAVRTIPRVLYTMAAAAQSNVRNLEWGMTRKVVITLTLED